MKRFPLDPDFLWQLFFGGGAGVEIAGESGSGKSRALIAMLTSSQQSNRNKCLLDYVHFLLFIDPDHDTAEELYHYCISNPRLAPRVVYFKMNDPHHCGSFNPNAVIAHPDPAITEARRSAKIEQKIKIQLSAWGETNLDSRPTLAKNSYRVAHTCSRLGLPPVEELLFLDTQSDIYPILCQGVENPVHRAEMLELSTMRPVDREAQLGSYKNRQLTMYDNPIMRAAHSKTSNSGAYVFDDGYRRGDIVIVNAHRGTTNRLMDQQVFCNEFLSEYFSVVMSQPPKERRHSLLVLEELPVYQTASLDLLQANIFRLRKHLGRLVALHQGVHSYEGGVESPLLNLVRAACQTHFYFRSSATVDAKNTAEHVSLPTLNLKKVKYTQHEYEQYQAGSKIATLRDHSEGENESDDYGGGSSVAENSSVTHTGSHADHQSADPLHSAIVTAQSQATAQGTTNTTNKSWSKSRGHSRSVTTKQTIVPVMAWRRVLRKLEFWTAEEQYLEMASRISRQRTGGCFLFMNGLGAQQFQFPLLPEPFARSPKFGQRKIDTFQVQLLERPEFDTVENVEAYRHRFLNLLIDNLRKLPVDNGTGLILPLEASPNSPSDTPPLDEPKNGPWTI